MALSVTSPPYQQVNMPALDLRRYLGVGLQEGVSAAGDMAVGQRAAGANNSVDVAVGEALIQGDTVSNQGRYYVLNDAVANVTGFTAAHATLPRIDRVTLRIRDAFHGDAANDVNFQIVTGTATSGATLANLTGAAAVPASQLLLANVLVPANGGGTVTNTTANIDTTVRTRILTPVVPGMTQLYDSILGADTASFDITPISGSYSHLKLELYARGDTAAAFVGAILRFNNDSGSNYDIQTLNGQAAVASAAENFGATNAGFATIPANTAGANLFGGSEVVIPHYAGTANNKVFSSNFALKYGIASSNMLTGAAAGFWRSNSAINRITILPTTGNFKAASRCTLYGLT